MSQISEDFVVELAKACIVDKNILEIVRPHLSYAFLTNEQEKHIFKYIFDYHSANNASPTMGLLSQNVHSRDALGMLGRIREINVYDRKQQVVDEFQAFIKKARTIDLLKKSNELYNKGEHDKAAAVLAEEGKFIHEFSLKRDAYSKIYEGFEKRQDIRQNRDYSTRKVPTGIPAHDYLTRGGTDRGTGILGVAMTGRGKAQPLYSKVYTPNGFKLMGEINIGDRVLTENGVASIVSGVFPQGIRKVYRITFSDGVYVDCDEGHLWKVYTDHDRNRAYGASLYKTTSIDPDQHSIIELKNMIGKERVDSRPSRKNVLNYKMPICKPLRFRRKKLMIPPYTLGALIGDGHFQTTPTFSTVDLEILARISKELKIKPILIDRCNYRLTGCKLGKKVLSLFNQHVGASNKFIPKQYLYSSVNDRINLLRGLMDTDGSVKENLAAFHTSSLRLAEDMRELVNTLGGVARIINRGKKYYTYLNARKQSKIIAYDVIINLPTNINPFFVGRKAKKFNDRISKRKYITPRFIEKIDFIGDMETQCISVDNPSHLYITDGCVVTHNTTFIRSLNHHASLRGIPSIHFAGGDSTQQEIEDGYDAMWTGIETHLIKEGNIEGGDVKKIEKALAALRAQAGEIIVHTFKQFHSASILDCRAVIIDVLKDYPDLGLASFDLLESFDPGDGKKYGTTQDGRSARKQATSEKIINCATEFDIAVAAVTQASSVKLEFWNNPNFVIEQEHISNLKATLDPFAYAMSLNQTKDEKDQDIMRLHEMKFRHYGVQSWQQTYHIAQKRSVGRFIDVAETNRRFWNTETKQIIRMKPKPTKA